MMDEKAERAWGEDQSVAISQPRNGLKRHENLKIGLKIDHVVIEIWRGDFAKRVCWANDDECKNVFEWGEF